MDPVTFEATYRLLGGRGDVHQIELGAAPSNTALDYLGMDYLVIHPDGSAHQIAWRLLCWKERFTFTLRDRGLERMSEWGRLWRSPEDTMKPHYYVIAYHHNGNLLCAGSAHRSDLRTLPPDQWGRSTNHRDYPPTRFYYRDVPSVPNARIYDRRPTS